MTPKSTDFLIQEIKQNDPQFIGFLDAVFVLIDANSGDPDNKLTSKQIQQALVKFPVLTMRSKLALKLYNDYREQITETVVFPVPDTLMPADYQSGVDDDNSLLSCEFAHNDDVPMGVEGETPETEFEPEYTDYYDECETDRGIQYLEKNPDETNPKATKSKK